jgi:hypothetical protein
LYSQAFEWTADNFPGSLFRNVIEKNDSLIGIVTNATLDDTDVEYQLTSFSIQVEPGESDMEVDYLQQVVFPDHYATLAVEYIEATGLWLAFQSKFIAQGRYNLRAILFNDKFEILNEQSVDTLGYPLIVQIDSDGAHTYVLGFLLGPPGNELIYLEYSYSTPTVLPPIIIRQSEPNPMYFITSMNIDPRTGNMLVFSASGITILDSSFYQVADYNAVEVFTQDHGHLLGTGNYYYSHGARDSAWDVGLRKLVIHKYDTSFQILKADTLDGPIRIIIRLSMNL